ncbi:MAG: hypothetical protein ACQEVT_01105 [Pseudomonadota bacterium]
MVRKKNSFVTNRFFLGWAVLLGALLVSSAGVHAETPESEGMEAFRNQRYQKAVELLEPLATGSDYEAIGTLGAAYFHLDQRNNDLTRAMPHLQRAGENRDGRALHYLGIIKADAYLSRSLDEPQDIDAALALFQQSAEQGHPNSAATLIGAYLKLRPPTGWLPGFFAPDSARAMKYADLLKRFTDVDHGAHRWHLQLIGAAEWANGRADAAVEYLDRSQDPRALHDVAAIAHGARGSLRDYKRILKMYEHALEQNYKSSRMRLPRNELFVAAHLNMFELYFGAGRTENALICLIKMAPFVEEVPYFSEDSLKKRFAGAYKRLAARTNIQKLLGEKPKDNSEMIEILQAAEACRMSVQSFYKRFARSSIKLMRQIYEDSNTSSEPILLFLPPRKG